MKKSTLLLLLTIIAFSCNKETPIEIQEVTIVTLKEIQAEVEAELEQGKVYYWANASDELLWSAGMHSDSVFSIGYTIDPSFDIASEIHKIDIKSQDWTKAKDQVLNLILAKEKAIRNNKDLTSADLQPFGDSEYFPQIMVQLTNSELISELRKSDLVRFIEPVGFSIEDLSIKLRSGQGCNADPNYSINSSDYTTIAPSTKLPWNYNYHSIEQAWSASQGDNIRLAIIDTGASNSQDNLGSQFTSGYSGNRSVQKYSTLYSGSWWWASLDSPHDQCGHGTSMAGFATAPRGTDGNAVGVAYKADLMSIRATNDVIISSSNERKGVRDALYLTGNRNDVKIVSMSIGTPFYSSTVADGVYYAYNKGKLLMAAAGTSLSWTSWYPVIFPANMSQTVAVTGLKDSQNNVKCTVCHSGPEVDFTIVMERSANDDRTSISLASYSNQPKYTGGSSCATSTAAGIAALVWAQNPSASRYSVMQSLKNASEFYPNRHDDFGWGRLNALTAVGGGGS